MGAVLPLALAGAMSVALLAQPAQAQPNSPSAATASNASRPSRPGGPADPAPKAQQSPTSDAGHRLKGRLKASQLPPLSADKSPLKEAYGHQDAPRKQSAGRKSSTKAAAACDPADFTGRTGSELVRQIKASTTGCVNTLFSLTGDNARLAFREAQMVSVAYALRDNSAYYPGDGSTGIPQLVLYLRAGYYVQWYNPDVVGPYGPALRTAIRSGLDGFFASPRSRDVTDDNGETLSEAVILIDSAAENARYISVVKRMLADYDSSWNAFPRMLAAVNNVYTVTFRGHQVPAFVSAVESDPSLIDSLYRFAADHLSLLEGDQAYLTSNAGRELSRFLQHPSLRSKVRPQATALLRQTSITGPTAPLWVGIAEMADYYDRANCSTYGICDLQERLKREVLPVRHTCSPSIRILAQQMTSAELNASCTSLIEQDAYFHRIARDNGPVADDNNTAIEVIAYDSSADYQTYAGAMYGIDTNNGGMYLEGDPSVVGNQPRFIAYEAEWLRPDFHIWNLNHEYTHYLDGRFTMYGDFAANMTTPTIWWVEGFAEYISYHYREEPYTAAMTEAGKSTYALSTLFSTDYSHDTTRVYRWGYLAVRYMLEKHPADLDKVLGHYRAGEWSAARTYLTSTIGTRYDSDWKTWLAACAAGDCGGGGQPGNQAPAAGFTAAVKDLTVTLTDRSTDADGTIASRAWDFGDGTTSTRTNPAKTYSAAGSYTVRLTVTDDKGATDTATREVTVAGGSAVGECTDSDTRVLGKDCRRSNLSATTRDYSYLYLNIPAGTEQLKITVSGGTGDADLYYSNFNWATTGSHTNRATGPGNSHTLTISNPPSGANYISLHAVAAFSGATVTTEY
ncbi:collagenase [Streptomyces sp. SM11]|uniref:collagenase n=1 Tax=Streptomyces sp. SM11 TaxID=565557 RepID=UPI000CD59D15